MSISAERAARSDAIDVERENFIAKLLSRLKIDWSVLKGVDPASAEDRYRVLGSIAEDLQNIDDLYFAAVAYGWLLARWNGQQFEEAEFAEMVEFEEVLAKFAKKLKLNPQEVESTRLAIQQFITKTKISPAELTNTVLKKVVETFSRAVKDGITSAEFFTEISKSLKSFTTAQAETAFRTSMTHSYSEKRLTDARSTGVFLQYIGLTDDRQTLTICKPMSGYIAAASDPIWDIWRPPNHYNCRSDLSPIGNPEAVRRGIARRVGPGRYEWTKGSRPYGDPPEYAVNEKNERVRVRPAPGFD